MLAEGVVDGYSNHAQNEGNRCGDRHGEATFLRTSRRFKSRIVDDFEYCLIEVTLFVRVRIEEETLGATLHGDRFFTLMSELEGLLENATGFLEDRTDFGFLFLLLNRRFHW